MRIRNERGVRERGKFKEKSFPTFLKTLVLKIFSTANIQYNGVNPLIFHAYVALCVCVCGMGV